MCPWPTLALLLPCVLLLQTLCIRAADEREHVHIKVRVPEVLRKHTHQQVRTVHKHHRQQGQPHQHFHHPPQPYILHSHGRKKLHPLSPPLPMPPLPHNHLDMEQLYGDDALTLSDFGDDITHLPAMLPPASLDNKANELMTAFNLGPTATLLPQQQQHAYSSEAEQQQQHLLQHMQLMSALAEAAAASTDDARGGADEGERDGETNTLLADDFLADMQRVYANNRAPLTPSPMPHTRTTLSTYPLTTEPRVKRQKRKKQQHHTTPTVLQNTALGFQLSSQQHPPTMTPPHQQQFYTNYFPPQRPIAQPLYGNSYSNSNNHNDNYNSYPLNSDEDDADEATSNYDFPGHDAYNPLNDYDESLEEQPNVVKQTNTHAHGQGHGHGYGHGHEYSYGHRTRHIGAQHYNNNNNYKNNANSNNNHYFASANAGANPVSYHQQQTANGAYTYAGQQHTMTPLHYPHPLQPGMAGEMQHQQQQDSELLLPPLSPAQFITTAQPINVVGPTATDFDDELQQPQTRHKKRKSRIKRKPKPKPPKRRRHRNTNQ